MGMKIFKIAMIISMGLSSAYSVSAEPEEQLSIASRAIARKISGFLMDLAIRINNFAADRVDHSVLESDPIVWAVESESIGSRITSSFVDPANRRILASSILGSFLVLAATRPELFARFKNYLMPTKKASGQDSKQRPINIYITSPGGTKRTVYRLGRKPRSQGPAQTPPAVEAVEAAP
jgi:hypothetical protein